MYSAVKIRGKRLYEYAREGKIIERTPRQVEIEQIQVTSKNYIDKKNPSFCIHVTCSKGTYIRTLAVDIGRKLGYPAHMSYLKRTSSGPFNIEASLTFSEIEEALKENIFHEKLFPIDHAVTHFEKIIVDEFLERKILNGAVLPLEENKKGDKWTMYNENGEFIAIYIPHPSKPGVMKPEKIIKIKNN